MSSIIIDRRKNPKAKSLSNRQRFVERSKALVKEAAKKALGDRNMDDQSDVDISISSDGLDEPHFHDDPSVGEYDYVLPGNKEYIVGDIIRKPPPQKGGGGNGGGNGGGGEDNFEFALSYSEFLEIVFDGLELPELVKQSERDAVATVPRRAGTTTAGIPSNINVERTMISSLSRRIALKFPKLRKIKELEKEQATCDDDERRTQIEAEITKLRAKARAIGFLDNVDLRYNNFVPQPRPVTKAVMFCLMDVSASMGEREKIISKKFFLLLNLFLRRKYGNVDVVFVRHHDTALECSEQEFYTLRESGGTIVSSGYDLIKKIIIDRYDSSDWNIYIAQASDGDNYDDDEEPCLRYMDKDLLPVVQHFVYLEIARNYSIYGGLYPAPDGTSLGNTMEILAKSWDNLSIAQINDESQVINIFRKIFSKDRVSK